MKIFKNIPVLFASLAALLIGSSCEEIIEIDLNSSNPKVVAEGILLPDSLMWLRLSYTTDYFNMEAPVYLEDAKAILSDGNGNTDTLKYRSKGIYMGSKIKGAYENTYTLSFSEGETKYSAQSKLNAPCTIEKVWFEEGGFHRPGKKLKSFNLHLQFTDDSIRTNYYMLKIEGADSTRNSSAYTLLESTYYSKNGIIEYSPARYHFSADARVSITIYAIDENTYAYYSQLNDLQESKMGGSSTPYNPKSNFGNEVMGFFKAWSYTSYEGMVK